MVKDFISVFKLFLWTWIFIGFSCQSKPKKISPLENTEVRPSIDEMHKATVQEFMHASRYTYLKVVEQGGNPYWIAAPFTEVTVGESYYFRSGTQVLNFRSGVHDRTFDTLYLVDAVHNKPKAEDDFPAHREIDMHGGKEITLPVTIDTVPGVVRLSDLYQNREAYDNERVLVSGQCVKVNRNIMGKNWIHLQDGSRDDNDQYYDLTISSEIDVSVGEVVILEGTITLDKDLGSGYHFDIIMEEAVLRNP